MATIYMPLLEEGTDVWRPVNSEQVSENIYLIEGPVPMEEDWAFQPGSIVRCEMKSFGNGQEGLVAVELKDECLLSTQSGH